MALRRKQESQNIAAACNEGTKGKTTGGRMHIEAYTAELKMLISKLHDDMVDSANEYSLKTYRQTQNKRLPRKS